MTINHSGPCKVGDLIEALQQSPPDRRVRVYYHDAAKKIGFEFAISLVSLMSEAYGTEMFMCIEIQPIGEIKVLDKTHEQN